MGIVTVACDVTMPRSRFRPWRAVYWWSEEIADLRRVCVEARRRCTTAVKRNPGGETAARAKEELAEARHAFRASIAQAKAVSWRALTATLDEDPWGRPYKLVMNQFRLCASPATEIMDPQTLEGAVSSLFPDNTVEGGCPRQSTSQIWTLTAKRV